MGDQRKANRVVPCSELLVPCRPAAVIAALLAAVGCMDQVALGSNKSIKEKDKSRPPKNPHEAVSVNQHREMTANLLLPSHRVS